MTSSNLVTEYGLDALAAILHETAIEKGFWDGTISYDKVGNKLALVHSEVTEVLEAIRKNKSSEEVVDVFLTSMMVTNEQHEDPLSVLSGCSKIGSEAGHWRESIRHSTSDSSCQRAPNPDSRAALQH